MSTVTMSARASRLRRAGVGLGLTVCTALLASCGSDEASDPVPAALPDIPTVEGGAGAIADARFDGCESDQGEQKVTGKVTSSAAETVDYVVTVSWVGEKSQVLARDSEILYRIKQGDSQDFELTADVPAGAKDCTFNVLRGTVPQN